MCSTPVVNHTSCSTVIGWCCHPLCSLDDISCMLIGQERVNFNAQRLFLKACYVPYTLEPCHARTASSRYLALSYLKRTVHLTPVLISVCLSRPQGCLSAVCHRSKIINSDCPTGIGRCGSHQRQVAFFFWQLPGHVHVRRPNFAPQESLKLTCLFVRVYFS